MERFLGANPGLCYSMNTQKRTVNSLAYNTFITYVLVILVSGNVQYKRRPHNSLINLISRSYCTRLNEIFKTKKVEEKYKIN